MKMSKLFLPTLFEEPHEAELISHKLMLRAGLIRRLASGVYSYLPLGYRVLTKVSRIVEEEMDAIGGQQLLLPALHPKELWEETGRWQAYGPDMFKLSDRRNRDFGLGPTHEEIITDLVRSEVRSYRQLPLLLYQIQTKFRDEIRPRFGLMRAREFQMKDGYSFDADQERADKTYELVYQAYGKIFSRCGLSFRAVEAESGLIGGSASHEFMVPAEAGEDLMALCSSCDYAANLERAECGEPSDKHQRGELSELSLVDTPGMKRVDEVSRFLNVKPEQLVKTLIYKAGDEVVAALILGHQELNESKLARTIGRAEPELADPETISSVTGAPAGFAGPIGLTGIKIIADNSIKGQFNLVTGGNKADAHYIGANYDRDFQVDVWADIKVVQENDSCPRCPEQLEIHRGIEVGHVFKLGTKYSQAMGAVFVDEDGQEKPFIMDTFGIGVSRIIGAVIETSHDENGIIWPMAIAPYQVIVVPINVHDEEQWDLSLKIYQMLQAEGIEVLLDDRDERPGRKFTDSELIGIPIRIVIGNKTKKTGQIEISIRRTGEKRFVPLEDLSSEIKGLVAVFRNQVS
ncbi:MAG: proline--tRNA ligase [bacterium]|nr:proline--tRNA ligase [bacterium]